MVVTKSLLPLIQVLYPKTVSLPQLRIFLVRPTKGLEISSFGTVDIVNNTYIYLIAKQTLVHKKYDSLIEYYDETIRSLSLGL